MTDEPTAAEPEQAAPVRILRAAEVLFARDGFDRTPVSKIAKLAGVPHGLVFYYFQTKIGLLLTLIRNYSSSFVVVLDDVPGAGEPGNPVELVDRVLDTMRERLRSRTDMRRILFQEMGAHPEVREQVQTFHRQASEAMSVRFQQGMASLGRPVDPGTAAAAARMVIATAVVAAMVYEQDDPRMPLDDLATAVAHVLEAAAR